MEQTANLPVTQESLQVHQDLTQRLPIPIQVSWLRLADLKSQISKRLTDLETAAQKHLLKWETDDLLTLQNAIAAYKKEVNAIPEVRKGFTTYLDKITSELMQPEKRAAAWEVLGKAEARRIELAKAAEEAGREQRAKDQEVANFTAHIKNEYARVSAEYKQLLARAVAEYYKNALAMDLDDAGIQEHIRVSTLALGDIRLPEYKKFDYKLHTKEEMIPHAQAIPKPDIIGFLNEAKSALHATYSMYFSDKANAEEAKKNIDRDREKAEEEIKEQYLHESAANTLMAQGAAFTISEPNGIKPLVSRQEIVVDDEDVACAHKILTAFLANWGKCIGFLQVRKWGNLSVSQMAAALDKAEIKVAGVKYKEVCK